MSTATAVTGDERLVRRAGSSASDPYLVDISADDAGWSYSGLRVLTLTPEAPIRLHTGDSETLVVPLSGSVAVACDNQTFELAGRSSVFAGPTDFAYLPTGSKATLVSATGGRFVRVVDISGPPRTTTRFQRNAGNRARGAQFVERESRG